jgi:YrbI family 3-deoxy-D-manno-octulosonate 8-phosphate phosphatase
MVNKKSKTNSKIKRIKLLIMDVDGVLTDGSIYVDNNGNESVRFSRIDGKGIELLKNKGILTGVISQENASAVRHRLKKLKIDMFSLGEKEKIKTYEHWKSKYKLKDENVCVCGDDVNDTLLMKSAGFSCAPANALAKIKANADFVSKLKGGEGFVREVCEILIGEKNKK